MQYMLLIYEPENAYVGQEGQAKLMDIVGKHMKLSADMRDAGVMQAGAGLQPGATATTIKTTAAGQTLHDGPFAETREMLGGFYMIEAPDLDGALAWARRIPVLPGGMVEVRPVAQY